MERKTSTTVKNRYNAKTYHDYRVPVRLDSELYTRIEAYREEGGSVATLVKDQLKDYFKNF